MAKETRKTAIIFLEIEKSNGSKEKIKVGTFVGKGDAMISARALQEKAPKNYRYFVD